MFNGILDHGLVMTFICSAIVVCIDSIFQLTILYYLFTCVVHTAVLHFFSCRHNSILMRHCIIIGSN